MRQEPGFGYADLSRDGRRIAVSDSNELRILDAPTGRLERTIDRAGSWGHPPVFSPDGTLVAMPDCNAVAIFEVATGRRLHHDPSTPVGYLISAAWAPSGDRFVTGHTDGFVRVWDAASGRLIWHKLLAPAIGQAGGNGPASFVGFSRDGRYIVAAGPRDDPVGRLDGIVAIYAADGGETVRQVPLKRVRSAALSPDGRMIVAATSHALVGVELATGRTRWSNPPEKVTTMQFEAHSPWFQAALRDGTVILFNALTGHEQRRFLADWRTPEQKKAKRPREPDMWDASFGTDGRTLVSSQMEWIYVWDVESGTMRRKIRHPHRHGCNLTLAPDGRTLATSDLLYSDDPGEDTIRLYDIESGAEVLTLEPRDDRAHVLAFSPGRDAALHGLRPGHGDRLGRPARRRAAGKTR